MFQLKQLTRNELMRELQQSRIRTATGIQLRDLSDVDALQKVAKQKALQSKKLSAFIVEEY